jgi:hypothetical protein
MGIKKVVKKKAVKKIKLVKMKRGEQSADVHPEEVDNYKKAGWTK